MLRVCTRKICICQKNEKYLVLAAGNKLKHVKKKGKCFLNRYYISKELPDKCSGYEGNWKKLYIK